MGRRIASHLAAPKDSTGPLEHGGHSLEVPKRLKIPQETIDALVQDTIVAWVRALA